MGNQEGTFFFLAMMAVGAAILLVLMTGADQHPDERNLSITLLTGCEGGSSRLTIRNGSAIFYEAYYLAAPFDIRRGTLTDGQLQSIADAITEHGFFSLGEESYENWYATDLCHKTLTIELDNRTKTVREYGEQGPAALRDLEAFLADFSKNLPKSDDVKDCEALETSVQGACYDYFASENCNFSEKDVTDYGAKFLVDKVGAGFYAAHFKLAGAQQGGSRVSYNISGFRGIDTIGGFLDVKSRYDGGGNGGCSLTVSNSYILTEPVEIKMTRDEAMNRCASARNESRLGYDSMDYIIGYDFVGDYGITLRFRNTTQPLMVLCQVNLNTGRILTTKELYKTGGD